MKWLWFNKFYVGIVLNDLKKTRLQFFDIFFVYPIDSRYQVSPNTIDKAKHK